MSDEDALKHKENGDFVKIYNLTPSEIIEKIDKLPQLPVITRFDALYLAVRHSGILKGHYHNFANNIVGAIDNAFTDPYAVIRLTNGRLNILSPWIDEKKKYTVMSFELNTQKDINNKYDYYNLVVTFMQSPERYIKNIVANAEKVEYEKEDLSQVNPQLHEWLAIVNEKSSKNSIPDSSAKKATRK